MLRFCLPTEQYCTHVVGDLFCQIPGSRGVQSFPRPPALQVAYPFLSFSLACLFLLPFPVFPFTSTRDGMSSSISIGGVPVPESLIPYLTGQLKDDGSVQDTVFRFNITFAVLVALAVGLRMVVRFGIIRAAGTDDSMSPVVAKLYGSAVY